MKNEKWNNTNNTDCLNAFTLAHYLTHIRVGLSKSVTYKQKDAEGKSWAGNSTGAAHSEENTTAALYPNFLGLPTQTAPCWKEMTGCKENRNNLLVINGHSKK